MSFVFKGEAHEFKGTDIDPLKERALDILKDHGIYKVSSIACCEATAKLYDGVISATEAVEHIVNAAFFAADFY